MTATSPDNSKIRILLAEDEAPLRSLLNTIFENAGFTVLVAEDGQQAAHLPHEHNGAIDLLVSNVQIPHMTGPDLAKIVKASSGQNCGSCSYQPIPKGCSC